MIFPDASKPARMGKNKTSNKKGLETMKQMRKILVLLLAVVMVMSLATTAFAANTTAHTITVNNQIEGYTYEAYRIFEGTLKDSGELQDLNWSDGVNSTALMTALKEIDAFKDCETPADVANVLNGTTKDNATAQAFADAVAANLADKAGSANTVTKDKGYEINVTGDGYYFVKTTTVPEATDTTAEGTYTRYILKVVGNVTVTHKGNVPTVTKVIVEGDDEKKASDAAVGDTVTFKLTATLPSDYDYYKAYQLIFNDTLSTGLTYNGDAKVYLDSVADTYEITSNFTIAPDAAQTTGGGNLTITCTNLKNVTGVTNSSKIIVEYTATLNSGAVVGPNGNPNTVKLNYSNNPNDDGTGTTSTGETPEDKVIVFTYELDVTKIDGVDENIKLEGVEFKLYRKNSDNANEYAIVNNNKITGWTTTKANGTTLTTDGDGQIKIAGLDSATYYLEETKARDGYNLPDDPFEVVISADVTETGITDLSATIGGSSGSADKTTGVVSGTIENNSGATLPETGGIGTTIFYVLGGVMVLAAAVLLVTKKRMSAAE